MNLLNNIIIVLLLIVSGVSFAQDDSCKSPITINTDINNYHIYLNGKKLDSIKNLHLHSGNYILKLVESDGKWNSKEITDTITVQNCDPLNLSYSFSDNNYFLQTDPSDAEVIKNDSVIGYTPLLLSTGYSNLLLSKKDYAEKLISTDELRNSPVIKLDYIGNGENQSFYGSPKFLVLVGTAIALGAATAYYKLKADDKFDEYQITGNPDLLDETDRYDLISGITFTAMQIDFGAIIYFFLTE